MEVVELVTLAHLLDQIVQHKLVVLLQSLEQERVFKHQAVVEEQEQLQQDNLVVLVLEEHTQQQLVVPVMQEVLTHQKEMMVDLVLQQILVDQVQVVVAVEPQLQEVLVALDLHVEEMVELVELELLIILMDHA